MARRYFKVREEDVEVYLSLTGDAGDILSCPVVRSISLLGGCRPGEGIFDLPDSKDDYLMVGEQALNVLFSPMKEKAREAAVTDYFGRPCVLLHVGRDNVHPGIKEVSTPELLPLSWSSPYTPQETE